MQLFSALPLVRARQIAADTAALAGIVVSVLVGIAVAALIRPLGDLGRSMEESGTRLSGSMTDAADALGRLPLVGDAARGPFEDASGIGSGLVQAGRDQQSLVGTIALVLGLLVALVPIAFIVRHWLLRRISFVRRAATSTGGFRGSKCSRRLGKRIRTSRTTVGQAVLIRGQFSGWSAI